MASRPFWSGQMKISLVSFGIQLFPATSSAQSGIAFHQIDRETGQRIHHQNVLESGEPVEDNEIVKGYEYTRGKYIAIEPSEVADLRIATRRVIEIGQFVDLDSISPALFEKPYFVLAEPRESPNAFATVRRAMEQTRKAAVGEIAFGGREHLVAIALPSDSKQPGMMAYTLRYKEELRDSSDYFSGVDTYINSHVDRKQLAMATQLIQAYSAPLNLDEFRDDYESALRQLIEAKQKNLPLPVEEKDTRPAKVVNLMDALRQSIRVAKPSGSRTAKVLGRTAARASAKKGPVLVGKSRRRHKAA